MNGEDHTMLTVFVMQGCPYCRNARRAVEELLEENPAYRAVEIAWIDENRQPELAAQHEYYYVPSAFLNGEKRYEARPGESYGECKTQMRLALDAALNG